MVMLLNMLLMVSVAYTEGMLQGRDVSPTAYRWLAGMLTFDWIPRCSGTLVTSHYVLTACACLVNENYGNITILEPSSFIVVIPSHNDSLRNIDVFIPHPDFSLTNFLTVGLIGVSPSIRLDKFHGNLLPLWDFSATSLEVQFDYVLKNIEFFRCVVVTWKQAWREQKLNKEATHVNYELASVSALDIVPIATNSCISAMCNDTVNDELCERLLMRTHCGHIVDPFNAQFCGSDRGAGLACEGFLWGVLAGGASCTNEEAALPIFTRMDGIIQFIVDETFGSYKFGKSLSSILTVSGNLQTIVVLTLWSMLIE